jgi:general secretion pathway protein K
MGSRQLQVVGEKMGLGSIWRNQRGMALLITIMTVALLVAVTVEFHKTTWGKFLAANNFRAGAQLKTIADSGVNIAVAVLEKDGVENQFDSFLDSWASLASQQFTELFPTGTLQLEVADLSGRLPINSLVVEKVDGKQIGDEVTASELRILLFRMLLSGAFAVDNESEARSIVDAIVDWIDEDDNESEYGAENGHYQSLDKPYSCKNRPLQTVEELLLVKGITPALLFGSPETIGLANYLTVFRKDGKINLNTAAPLILNSLDPLMNEQLVEKIDIYRKDKNNKEYLKDPNWYRNIGGWPGDIVLNQTILTVKSTFFMIIATGVFDTLSRRLVANVERLDTNEVNLLGKRME